MSKLYALLAVVVIVLLSSCGNSGSQNTIEIDGSSTVYPITEAVAEEFRNVAPQVRVTIGASGTGGGFSKFLRGITDINNASRYIQPSEMDLAEQNDIEYVRLSVAYDGLSVVVNPQNDWVEFLTVEELEKIWSPESQNTVTQWSDIRPEWPDEPFHLYGPGVASGTFDYFTEVIVGEAGASRGDYTASEDDNVLVQGVSTDKYALGFFGLAYYVENKEDLKLVAVKDGEGEPVKPTFETVSKGTYTPLTRPVFIYVSKEAARKEAVQKFVTFYLNNVDELADQIGYIPLPDSQYEKQLQKFKAFVPETDTSAAQ